MAKTRYLKLELSADLTADAKSNLLKIDSLGAATSVEDGDLLLRATENIVLQPQSADIAGNGSGGEIVFGDTDHSGMTITSWADEFFLNCALSIKNSASGKTNFISLDFNDSSSDASNQTLTIGLDGESRTIDFSTSGEVVVVDETGETKNIKEIGQLDVALSVENGGTGSQGPANDPHVLDNLVPAYAAAQRGYALAVDDDDEANGLIWKQFAAGGTVTSVGLDVTAIPEFTLSATSNPIGVAGTFTLSKTAQQAAKVYAGPTTGGNAVPTFRSLVKTDLPALTTTDIAEGTNQYFTEGRAQSAVVVQVLNIADTTHSPSSSSVLNQLSFKENTITAGTTSQYWRGDKSWQTLNTDSVPEGTAQYFTTVRAQTAAVVDSTAGNETTQAPSVSAMKSYVGGAVSGGTYSTTWAGVIGIVGTTVNHNLGSLNVIVSVYDADGKQVFIDDIDIVDANNVTLTAYQFMPGPGQTWTVVVQK